MEPGLEAPPAESDADLERLLSAERAFGAGDYRALRRVLAGSDPRTRSSLRARRLLAVTLVDPAWPAVLTCCAILLALLAWRYFAR
jgi:hypothetical protein